MTDGQRLTSLVEICGHTFYLPALGKNSIIIDLGASTAAFSHRVQALSGCHCHCVEAAKRNFQAIKETARVHKHFAAMGGTDGPVMLNIVQDDFHWGSLDASVGFDVIERQDVLGRTLSGLLSELRVDTVDLLKVDIEGAEIGLFDAADDATLRRCRQMTIEFHDFMDPAQTADVKRQLDRFEGLGFDCVVMTRQHHGDVWVVNRAALGLTSAKLFYYRTALKYGRGLRRILRRTFGRTIGKAA